MSDVRIAMVTSRYPYGGADAVAMRLVRRLEDRHELTLITTGDRDEEHTEDGHRRIVIGMPRRPRFWHHYHNPSVVHKLRKHLRRLRPDVVHFHSVANRTFGASALLVSKDYPTVWSLHDVWSQCVWHKPHPASCERMLGGCLACHAMPGFSVANRFLKERVWRKLDAHLVLCSEWMRRFFARSALGRLPTTVIPNGVDCDLFEGQDREEARRSLGIPTSARVVLFVGNMTIPVKGHRELLRIARRVVEDDADAWFVFVGRHAEPPTGHERIVLTGGVSAGEIPGMFAAADVFAFPSHAEYAPLVILEAMAAGVPQVTYAVGGIPEQVVDGETGVLVRAGDETGFETALRGLLDDAGRRASMGRAARERARRRFALDEQVARTEGLYGQAIAEREAKSGRTPGAREPLVSIVMPAYNTGRFIAQAIRSVLRQTWTRWELIIIDDGSTDDTAGVVARFPDPRIHCISRENTGLSTARNEGICRARGEYIAFLDSDDLWFPRKLEAQVETLEEDPEVGLTYSNFWYMDEQGVRIGAPRLSLRRLADGACLDKLLVRNAVLGGGTTVMVRRGLLEKVGSFDPELPVSEDWDLWRRLAVHCRFRYLPQALGAYRMREGSLTGRHDLLERCDRMVIDRGFADPEVRRRVPAGRRKRLHRRAEAVRLYNIGSRHLRSGEVAHAAAGFTRSVTATLYDFRQLVMLVLSLAALLPFVNRDRLLTVIGK